MLASACALLPVLLAACSNNAQTGLQLDPHQILVYPNTSINSTTPHVVPDMALDPAFATDSYSQIILNMIQVQLYTFDSNMNIIPDAAKGLPKISADGKTYTITLRDGLQWSDGTPMLAKDFKLGLMHDLDPNLGTQKGPYYTPDKNNQVTPGGQPQLFFMGNIVGASEYANANPGATGIPGIATPDDHTIEFTLKSPAAYFLGQLATMASMPLESTVFQQHGFDFISSFKDGVAQSGPFIIQKFVDDNHNVVDPTKATEIIFVPNNHWYGKPVTLREVDMPLIGTQNQMFDAYNNNQVDYTLVPSHEYQFTQGQSDFHELHALQIDYFGMNHLSPPFDNLKVRQAFDLALNKQILVDNSFQGARTPSNHIIPYGIAGYNPNLLNPPDQSASAAVSGDQGTAQKLIKSVADACENDYNHDWCPYIIGVPPIASRTTDFYGAAAGCPDFTIGTVHTDPKTTITTQTPIGVYSSSGNPDRQKLADAATTIWAKVLCLNVVQKHDDHFARKLNGGVGQAGPVSIWTLSWGADYPDAQDFTSLQFIANATQENVNFDPDAKNALAQLQLADKELDPQKRITMYQQAEQLLVNDVAWLPFSQPKFLYKLQTYVKGYSVPVDEVVPDQSWPDIFIAAHS